MSSDATPPENPSPGPNDQNPALRARVPDNVAEGCFSTGAIVMTGPSEFIVDFLQTIGRPHRIAARVVIPHPVMPQFIDALNTNLNLYRDRFGDPHVPPQTPKPDARRPSPQEIYDDLKMPDEVLSGVYANGVMIGHGATEFGLDFLTSFFPQSAVSARVFVSAGQIPRLLDSLRGAVKQLEQRRAGQNPDQSAIDGVEGTNLSSPAPDTAQDDSPSGELPPGNLGDGDAEDGNPDVDPTR